MTELRATARLQLHEGFTLHDAAAQVPITVIPCCTDFAAFPPVTAEKRIAARAELGISQSAKVAGHLYLGRAVKR